MISNGHSSAFSCPVRVVKRGLTKVSGTEGYANGSLKLTFLGARLPDTGPAGLCSHTGTFEPDCLLKKYSPPPPLLHHDP